MIDRGKLSPTSVDKARLMAKREADRVAAMLDRDARTRDIDRRRDDANRDLANGRFVNLLDTVDTLPDEQLAAGEFVPVEVDNPEGTVREQRRTIRRVARIVILHRRGVIDEDGLAGCLWYVSQWERSGRDPLIASTFEPKFGSGERDFGHLARTHDQASARDQLDLAREHIPADVRRLFDAVALDELTITEAALVVGCPYRNATAAFRRGVIGLIGYTAPLLLNEQKLRR